MTTEDFEQLKDIPERGVFKLHKNYSANNREEIYYIFKHFLNKNHGVSYTDNQFYAKFDSKEDIYVKWTLFDYEKPSVWISTASENYVTIYDWKELFNVKETSEYRSIFYSQNYNI